jgi:hypothetical protein
VEEAINHIDSESDMYHIKINNVTKTLAEIIIKMHRSGMYKDNNYKLSNGWAIKSYETWDVRSKKEYLYLKHVEVNNVPIYKKRLFNKIPKYVGTKQNICECTIMTIKRTCRRKTPDHPWGPPSEWDFLINDSQYLLQQIDGLLEALNNIYSNVNRVMNDKSDYMHGIEEVNSLLKDGQYSG